jgi:mercuric transport protein
MTTEVILMRRKVRFPPTWALLAFLIPLAAATPAKEKTVTLQISGMTCGDCLSTVQSALERVKGVKETKMKISRQTHEAVVKYDPEQTKVEDLIKAVKNSRGMHAYDAKVKQK